MMNGTTTALHSKPTSPNGQQNSTQPAKITRLPSSKGSAHARPPWRIIPSPLYLKILTSGAKGPTYLFGTLVPRESVVLVVGESSAGKTVFLHALSYACATCTELLGMTPPHPLRVLHIDVESPGVVTRMLLRAIGTNPRWHFAKVDGKKRLLRLLKAEAKRYDVIIIDSIMVASPVKDEDSNAEANRQIWPFIKIARKSKVAILLLHNSGQGNPKEKFKSRGATARVDRPDMVLNLEDLGGVKRRIKVVKTRFLNLNQTLEFEIHSAPETPYGYRLTKAMGQPKTKQEQLERLVTKACRKYATRFSVVSRSPRSSGGI
jgi:archaellum biogenesis ATPase FlaH